LQFDVHCAHRVGDEEDFAPRLAAVSGFENAAFVVGFEDVAGGGDPDDVRVAGVNTHSADLSGVVESDKLPRLAAVG